MPLVVVPTPIGNLSDITARAVDVLRAADVIACEDTRRTLKLLNSLGIKSPLVSYHRHNERERAESLARRALDGELVALVSDAGTPGISDPGRALIEAAIELGAPLDVLPGPNAAIPALLLSGLPPQPFTFVGFVEGNASRRAEILRELASVPHTMIFYSAPHDVARDLGEMLAAFGDRPAAIVREISKVHQEALRGTLAELAETARTRELRGEMAVVVGGAPRADAPEPDWRPRALELRDDGMFDREIADMISEAYGISRNRVKKFLLEGEGDINDES